MPNVLSKMALDSDVDSELELADDSETDLDLEEYGLDEEEYELDEKEIQPGLKRILQTMHNAITVEAPKWYINPDFQTVLADQSKFDDLAEACNLQLPSEVEALLNCPEPPDVETLLALPAPPRSSFGVYAVIMTKPGKRSRLYVGSGTDVAVGVLGRSRAYRPNSTAALGQHIYTALKHGFTFAHVGILCHMATPRTGLVPRARAFVLAAEGAFALLLHAAFRKEMDVKLDHLQLWDRTAVEWDPLCGHLPFSEPIRGDLEQTEEELELAATRRRARRAANTRKYVAKRKAEDLDGYLAEARQYKNDWNEENRDQYNKTAERTRNKAKALERFFCDDCEIPFATDFALKKHKNSQTHKDTIAGIKKPPMQKGSIARAAVSSRAISNRDFFCSVCTKPFPNDWSLQRHLKTDLHKRKAAKKPSKTKRS